MKKIFLFVLVSAFAFSSCEKDDICDPKTPTTPRLIIDFYDFENPSVKKNVNSLQVIGEGMTDAVLFNGSPTTNGNRIAIPLKTVGNSTSFRFTLNSNNVNPALVDADLIRFNYTTQELFVSRACGYKSLFILNQAAPFVHTDPISANQRWIRLIEVVTRNIDNENEAHINIFF